MLRTCSLASQNIAPSNSDSRKSNSDPPDFVALIDFQAFTETLESHIPINTDLVTNVFQPTANPEFHVVESERDAASLLLSYYVVTHG